VKDNNNYSIIYSCGHDNSVANCDSSSCTISKLTLSDWFTCTIIWIQFHQANSFSVLKILLPFTVKRLRLKEAKLMNKLIKGKEQMLVRSQLRWQTAHQQQ